MCDERGNRDSDSPPGGHEGGIGDPPLLLVMTDRKVRDRGEELRLIFTSVRESRPVRVWS
jgi:hypothetical protein